jgi:hypothetical protein
LLNRSAAQCSGKVRKLTEKERLIRNANDELLDPNAPPQFV